MAGTSQRTHGDGGVSSTGRIERVKAANARLVPMMVRFGFTAIGIGSLGGLVCMFLVFAVPAGFVAVMFLLVAGLFGLVASAGAVTLIALVLHLLWTGHLVRSYRRDGDV
ncbi:hypothetical protein [Aeromicrobium sp. 179-A 4D2 NHS]|uniref:hypothetical protein n=1 Tax=Aeromicrobium sp. 179-A 4D2 NHS TaxID=3142375 RepID=UPI0039A0E392